MRFTALLITLALSGCAFGRVGLIRQQAAQMVPGCAVDEPGKVEWKEIASWLYDVDACGTALLCREQPTMRCQTKAQVAETLRCQADKLTIDHVDFAMGDPMKDQWWWGVDEISGCGRAIWCGARERGRGGEVVSHCEQPPDFVTIAAQLTIDTGCPIEQMQPQARQVFERRSWKAAERGQQPAVSAGQASWRIDACGRPYSCALTGGVAASVACKAALDAAAPRQQSDPPPPPAAPASN